MMKLMSFRIVLTLVVLLLNLSHKYAIAEKEKHHAKSTYIIHMDKSSMPETFNDHLWFASSLKSVSQSAEMLYTYKYVIHGFSTRLTAQEASLLAKQPGVLAVLPETVYKLHTTRTPEFLGLGKNEASLTPAYNKESDVIIGLLDTGVWPELQSYDDTGLGPIPSNWRGQCETGKNFSASSCNRKLIGARFFSNGYEADSGPINETIESKSPRDDEGHGTHTSTTVAGTAVTGANLFGFASGTARGMAPQARIAAYKVCWLGGCFASDLAAAIDMAIEDGVNILSMSLGGGLTDYYQDILAIGAFKATAEGILVSCSAGNGGPSAYSLSNVAPWMTTIGAGSIDRDFPVAVTLGNGESYTGVSLYNGGPLSGSMVPIVYGGNVSSTGSGNFCTEGSLIAKKVAGKIVICDRDENDRAEKGVVVKDAGGIGMILANPLRYGEELVADADILPQATVGHKFSTAIKKYVFSTPNPTATISTGFTQVGVKPSPVVTAFSSRGPNPLTLNILKPDIIAPGLNILAGWTGKVGPSGLSTDNRHVSFNIISGTSMSCPHVSGLAALLKGAHPEWSPAAIKSALMTTAYHTYKNKKNIRDVASGKPATVFDFGAGHVNPTAALDPGLVYDATVEDYLEFLCALNYTSDQIKLATNKVYKCDPSKKYRVEDLNYPSFAVSLEMHPGRGDGSNATNTVKYRRTLTNVGDPATYKVSVSSKNPSLKIVVEPESLSFSGQYEKRSYTVTIVTSSIPSGVNTFAHLEWSDGKHVVRSPIAFSWTF